MKILINLTFIVIFHFSLSKDTYFQLFSAKDQFSQVSFQTDSNGYVMRNYNNGTISFLDFQTTNVLMEINSNKEYSEVSFKNQLNLETQNVELLMNYPNSNLVFEGKNQFYMFYFEDFDNGVKGWSPDVTSTCGNNNNNFLGGPNKFANTEAKIVIDDIPDHTELRITANVHFFDNWEDDELYMLVNNEVVWYETYNWCPGALKWKCYKNLINVCGNDKPDKLSYSVDVTFQHSSKSLLLSFKGITNKSQNELSWGIDDVAMYIR